MPCTISLFRGDDPADTPASLERASLERLLGACQNVSQVAPTRWRHDDGEVAFSIVLPAEDPGRELELRVSWSTSDQLETILEFATSLAEQMGARAYDRQGKRFIERERVVRLRALGGFSPAAGARRGWRSWLGLGP